MSSLKVKFDRHGNVIKVVGNVGRTRMNRAANELWHGNIEPTFGYKLRRFVHRVVERFNRACENATEHIVGSQTAAEMPYIGIEEHSRG